MTCGFEISFVFAVVFMEWCCCLTSPVVYRYQDTRLFCRIQILAWGSLWIFFIYRHIWSRFELSYWWEAAWSSLFRFILYTDLFWVFKLVVILRGVDPRCLRQPSLDEHQSYRVFSVLNDSSYSEIFQFSTCQNRYYLSDITNAFLFSWWSFIIY